MYEIRKKKQKELQEKRWWNYALLAAGILLFSEGCSLLAKNTGYAAASILLGILLHSISVENLFERIFKMKPYSSAKIALIIFLFIIAVISYFINIKFIFIVFLNLASIILFVSVSFIHSMINKKK